MRSVEHGGPEMAPIPPHARIAPAKPWRSSISLASCGQLNMGAPKWPPSPPRSDCPGQAVALLDLARFMRSVGHGGPEMAPIPPTLGSPRPSRGAPRSRSLHAVSWTWGPRNGPHPPHARIAPAKPWRSSISLGWMSSIEHQHSARDFAGLHRAKGVVDVLEAAAARDHLVEQEPSLAVELQVQRDVEAEAVAAHPGRLHPALRPDGHPRKLHRRVRRQDADDGGGAADGEALDGLPHQRGVADGFERVVDAGALRERADGLDRIVVGAVDDVGGADASGHLQLSVEHVDADDLPRAADARALHDGQPDAAAAEHGDRLARRESRGTQRGAEDRKSTRLNSSHGYI